jgi:hypothetical protein
MRNLLLSVLLLSATALSASASTVTNSYSNEVTNGTRKLDIQNIRTEVGTTTNTNQGIKCETFGGTQNACNVSFDGKDLRGWGTSSNFLPVDPTAIITTVKETTNLSFDSKTTTNFSEDSKFSGTNYTHSVSAE